MRRSPPPQNKCVRTPKKTCMHMHTQIPTGMMLAHVPTHPYARSHAYRHTRVNCHIVGRKIADTKNKHAHAFSRSHAHGHTRVNCHPFD